MKGTLGKGWTGRAAIRVVPVLTGPVLVAAFLVMATLAVVGPARAVETKTWRTGGRDAFLAATLESLSVSSDGVVRLAPALEPVDGVDVPYVWSLLAAADGSIWAGTGNTGAVYRIEGLKGTKVHDPDFLQVESMIAGSNGRVLAGTAPDGIVLNVAEGGEAATLVDLPAVHVWAMARNSKGELAAATGEPARLYRVANDGTASVIYEGEADHFTALIASGDGWIVGDDREGQIRRIDASGAARVLFDAPEVEVKALALGADGSIYAAVNRDVAEMLGAGAAGGGAGGSGGSGASSGPGSAGGGSGGRGPTVGPVVYRLRPDGAVESIWTAPDATIQAMILGPGGELLVGTGGEKSGLYQIDPVSRDWSLLARARSPLILSLARSGNTLYLGTGSPGRVYRAGLAGSPTGKLLSVVHDAKQTSDWGVVSWDDDTAEGRGITLKTRSGNTEKPDATWSDWSAPLSNALGSAITSPTARYIQWEAVLTGNAALSAVTVSWAEKNLPPVVARITVSESGGTLQRGGDSGGPQPVVQSLPGNVRAEFSVSTQGSRRSASDEEASWARRYRTIRWEASDPNDDALEYRLEYRARGETAWQLLDEELSEPVYVLDTTRLPDGAFAVRVLVTDRPDNSPGEERKAQRESEFFLVDNAPPVVEGLTATAAGDSLDVGARVADISGSIKSAEISLDGEEWRRVLPLDRVWDERSEEIRVTIARPSDAAGDLLIRAFDDTGNKGVGRQPFPKSADKKEKK